MVLMRSQWPHTVADIVKSLDGVWGLVGATDEKGNLIRLERSLHEPLTYKITEYDGVSEEKVVREQMYQADEKEQAVKQFARALGFDG
jgi:hypothetical protein